MKAETAWKIRRAEWWRSIILYSKPFAAEYPNGESLNRASLLEVYFSNIEWTLLRNNFRFVDAKSQLESNRSALVMATEISRICCGLNLFSNSEKTWLQLSVSRLNGGDMSSVKWRLWVQHLSQPAQLWVQLLSQPAGWVSLENGWMHCSVCSCVKGGLYVNINWLRQHLYEQRCEIDRERMDKQGIAEFFFF